MKKKILRTNIAHKRCGLFILSLFFTTLTQDTVYYYKGSEAVNTASNWNTARNGSCTNASSSPTTASSDTYIVQGTTYQFSTTIAKGNYYLTLSNGKQKTTQTLQVQ